VDEEDATIELQHADGTLEEFDFDSWPEQFAEPAKGPADWSGSFDMNREDILADSMRPGTDWQEELDLIDLDNSRL
jgi:hypothetical protein